MHYVLEQDAGYYEQRIQEAGLEKTVDRCVRHHYQFDNGEFVQNLYTTPKRPFSVIRHHVGSWETASTVIKMQLKTAVKILFLAMVLVHSHPRVSVAKADSGIQEMQLITEFLYHAGPDDSRETALALALYGAKHKAVLMSAGHLADRGLLKDYGDQKREVFCLVVDGIVKESYRMFDE